jgi:hypothetical protein
MAAQSSAMAAVIAPHGEAPLQVKFRRRLAGAQLSQLIDILIELHAVGLQVHIGGPVNRSVF